MEHYHAIAALPHLQHQMGSGRLNEAIGTVENIDID